MNSSDNLHSYPPDNHHSSDGIYCGEGGFFKWDQKRWHTLSNAACAVTGITLQRMYKLHSY